MSKLTPNQVIAELIRIEVNSNTGQLYLVFEATDSKLKQEVLKDWTQDFEFQVKDKKLIYIKKD